MSYSADAIETEGEDTADEAGLIDDSGTYDAGRFGFKGLRRFAKGAMRRGFKIAKGGVKLGVGVARAHLKVVKFGVKASRSSLKIANKIVSNPYLATALTIAYPPAGAVIAALKAASSAEERATAILKGGNILKIAAKMAKQEAMRRAGIQTRGLDTGSTVDSTVYSAAKVKPRNLSKTGFESVLTRAPAAAKLSRERLASAASPDSAGYQDAGAMVGALYKVEPGDYPTKIATKLVKDANRWRELRAANPQKPVDASTGNFKTLNAGEMLNLPASWLTYLGIGTTPATPTPTTPVTPPGYPPMPTLPPTITTPVAPSIANATNLQAQMLLKGWAGDQPGFASPADFGQTVSDFDGLWGPRSTRICASYQTWSNQYQGTSLTVTGELNQGTYDSLVTYASTHIAGYTPPATYTPPVVPGLPTVVPGLPTVTPPTTPGVTPGAPGTVPPKPWTPGIPTGTDQNPPIPKPATSSSSSSSALPLLGLALVAAKVLL